MKVIVCFVTTSTPYDIGRKHPDIERHVEPDNVLVFYCSDESAIKRSKGGIFIGSRHARPIGIPVEQELTSAVNDGNPTNHF
jgi:hypothetical protein